MLIPLIAKENVLYNTGARFVLYSIMNRMVKEAVLETKINYF